MTKWSDWQRRELWKASEGGRQMGEGFKRARLGGREKTPRWVDVVMWTVIVLGIVMVVIAAFAV